MVNRQRTFSLAVIVLCLAVSMLACTVVEPTPTPNPTATPIPVAPLKVIIFCADETGSYPLSYFRSAVNRMADWFSLLVKPAQAGAVLYVRWIRANSYSDDAAALPPIQLSRIDPTPAPLVPIATAPPFDRPQAATNVVAATQTQMIFSTQTATVNQQLQDATKALQAPLAALRNLTDHFADSSDIWGCPQRATEIFQNAPVGSDKYLIIASDMERVGPQEVRNVQLTGVHVAVINYKCDDVNDCAVKSDYWNGALKQAGIAGTIRFLRPDETAATTQLFAVL